MRSEEFKKSQTKALNAVGSACGREQITPHHCCQVCDGISKVRKGRGVVAHHWKGYDFPLDVVWACRSCNTILSNITCLDLEGMKLYVNTCRRVASVKSKYSNRYYTKRVSIDGEMRHPSGLSFNEWVISNGYVDSRDIAYIKSIKESEGKTNER